MRCTREIRQEWCSARLIFTFAARAGERTHIPEVKGAATQLGRRASRPHRRKVSSGLESVYEHRAGETAQWATGTDHCAEFALLTSLSAPLKAREEDSGAEDRKIGESALTVS